ncbi:chemotaxis protein CheC [Oscillospiraceae bacterium PP1C4]
MPLDSYSDLNEIQLDVLREIGNIGSGNAATSLSSMLDKPVGINVPQIKILDYNQVVEALGGPETMIVGLLLSLSGDVTGMMMFLLQKDFAHMTLNSLIGQSFANFSEIDEIGHSAMKEVSNIMAASYVNAISSLTNLSINISVPDICVDMAGAILSVPAIHYANISDKIIFIEDQINTQEENAISHILMIPDVDSLKKIMINLGIEI